MSIKEKGKKLLDQLQGDAILIAVMMLERLYQGQKEYGVWNIKTDKRNLIKETIDENIDSAIYSTGELLKILYEEDKIKIISKTSD